MSRRRFKIIAANTVDSEGRKLYVAEAIPDGPDDDRVATFLVDPWILPEPIGDPFEDGADYEIEIRALAPAEVPA